ncbi:DUF1524 domain-containing protein [Arthrobacter sp.]|uniref:GmrSD restriction endonuclease domain-containing protein n=1 Tax=Arthrobacter sp. TaxID=1667 RepID=UPI00258B7D73|nr:DUF1524 domain-containing protein [Arthrobacter sp.]
MPKHRPSRTDFFAATVLASVLFVATACGGAAAPQAAPASSVPASSPSSPGSPERTTALPTTAPAATTRAPASPSAAASSMAPAPKPAAAAAGNAAPAFAAKALDVLAGLPVKGRAPKTGYSRAEFGQAWADVDRNGCDTRNDILNRDLTARTYKPGTRNCVVLTGVLADPYTSTVIDFVRGPNSAVVQIDHVVALSDAWQKGAQQLSVPERTAFANDPLNLLAVDGRTNQQKGDGDAATWLPPNKGYRCAYVARQISVKSAYKLWVTQAEHDAMARALGGCTGIPAPAALVQPPSNVFYQNCAAVRAAGAAPIRAGDPGFQSKFDRDGDGIGCE